MTPEEKGDLSLFGTQGRSRVATQAGCTPEQVGWWVEEIRAGRGLGGADWVARYCGCLPSPSRWTAASRADPFSEIGKYTTTTIWYTGACNPKPRIGAPEPGNPIPCACRTCVLCLNWTPTPAQVDDCIARYLWMRHMLATMAARKRDGLPLPGNTAEAAQMLGERRARVHSAETLSTHTYTLKPPRQRRC